MDVLALTYRRPRKRSHLEILYQDNHLLVVNKPPGLATMGVSEGEPSLVAEAKRYLKQKYQKPGNVYLGVVSRLDALASGAIVLARTSKAAARLTEQFRTREVTKLYWAVVAGAVTPPAGQCVDWVAKSEPQQKMLVVQRSAAGAQEARLNYRTLFVVSAGTLLEVELDTGRKHQIRVQLAHRGAPIVGDRKYGSPLSLASGKAIALHSRRLAFRHPVQQTELEFTAPLPAVWRSLGVADPEF